MLEQVGLGDRATKRIRALSGGQRRRVGLAQALLGTPELLVLDEPTTGLDPEQRVSLRGVLSEAARGGTVVLATHQTEDVAALCERVVVLDGGRVRFDGAVARPGRRPPPAGSGWPTRPTRGRRPRGAPAPAATATSARPRRPGPRSAEPTLEDAYLLLRGQRRRVGGGGMTALAVAPPSTTSQPVRRYGRSP